VIKFGTDGWRAVISDEFTFGNVRKVAGSIAAYLKARKLASKPLIVGYDARFLADRFAEEVVKVMEGAGISCFLMERDTPTPVVAWEVKDRKACGAVMLTASHNPPEYCGIKFIPDYAGPANETITKEIEQGIEGASWEGYGGGKVERIEPRERYLKYIESFVDGSLIKQAQLKVVVDPMFGSGRGYLDLLLQRLGCRTEEIHNYRDVLFGGKNPEPDDETLSELKSKVVENKADLGLAMDGDADRFGVVDEKGKFYSANQIIPLLFDYLVTDRHFTGSVVRSVATTHMIDRIAERANIEVFETPVGFKHIAKLMMEKNIIIGGEESGGLSIQGHIPEKDGILADLLVVEMLASRKKKLSECWAELTLKVGEPVSRKINLRLTEEQKQALMNKLKEAAPAEIGEMKVASINRVDGVKIILSNGSWVLIRPSGTEPLVRIYAESDQEERLGLIVDAIKSLV
jgi:phosphomannomutase